ncbi:MAG: MFS transporter [Caldilineaceae bacterium]
MTATFVRDRFTWLAYGMLAYFAYFQAALGPAIPFLRQELNLSYTVAGFHASAMAVGLIAAGLLTDRLALRWGRARVFWFGGGGMALGALLMVVGRGAFFTVLGAGIMGGVGGLLVIMIQATLAARHGPLRATAITESNVVAAAGALAVPALIGGFQMTGLGWRTALILGALLWLIAFWRFRHIAVPERTDRAGPVASIEDGASGARLPVTYWVLWGVIFAAVAIEWSLSFWGAEFMENSTGLSRAGASTAMSVFFGAVVVGRFFGSRLTRSYESTTLLLGALALIGLGFPFFWLSPSVLLTLIGLFVAGLGLANLFPLAASVALGVAGDLADTASSRMALGAGTAILLAPQILGALADQFGIQAAYGVVMIVWLGALVMTLIARQRVRV